MDGGWGEGDNKQEGKGMNQAMSHSGLKIYNTSHYSIP